MPKLSFALFFIFCFTFSLYEIDLRNLNIVILLKYEEQHRIQPQQHRSSIQLSVVLVFHFSFLTLDSPPTHNSKEIHFSKPSNFILQIMFQCHSRSPRFYFFAQMTQFIIQLPLCEMRRLINFFLQLHIKVLKWKSSKNMNSKFPHPNMKNRAELNVFLIHLRIFIISFQSHLRLGLAFLLPLMRF